MRHLVCFNFLPKRRISCPKGPRSHGFCGRTVAQAALNYVARSCLKSEGQQSFIPLAPHSWLRHIAPTCAPHGLPAYPPLWVAGESGTAGHPCPLSQCAPAAPRDPARAPTCPGASAQAGKARGTLSSLPAWAYGLGGPPRSPADTIRAGAATAQRRYLVGGLPQEHAPAIASRQGRSHVLPVQGDVRSQLVRAGSAVRGTPRQSGG